MTGSGEGCCVVQEIKSLRVGSSLGLSLRFQLAGVLQ